MIYKDFKTAFRTGSAGGIDTGTGSFRDVNSRIYGKELGTEKMLVE